MLSTFLDRAWTPTALYALFAYLAWSLRSLTNETLCYGLLAALTAYYGNVIFKAISHELKVDSLGKRAPVKRSLTPFNLGTLFEAVYYFSHHRNHEFWWAMFRQGEVTTVESDVLAGRLIFTADEENIKAILATQFADYGKGEQFQKVCVSIPSLPVAIILTSSRSGMISWA